MDRTVGPRCNIGPDEVARRRRSAIAMTIGVVMLAALLVVATAPGPVRLLIWPLATAAAVTWLQVVHRFCVAFGALGLENFGRLGRQSQVDREQRAVDRRRALQLVVEGSAIGLAVALGLAILPV
jgi:hypothetical protein